MNRQAGEQAQLDGLRPQNLTASLDALPPA
jgi:hypothetical protein